MFNNLTQRFDKIFSKLKGTATLTEENISEAISYIRKALLEADVALPVVKEFIESVKTKATGQTINKSLNPSQALTKIVHHYLVQVLGETSQQIKTRVKPPIIILLAGLQGTGKTTTAAKLAKKLKSDNKLSVMLTSTDIYRPAAIQQLETLAKQIKTDFFVSEKKENPVAMAIDAMTQAKRKIIDVLIIDTAGRLHIDETMLKEIKDIHTAVTPTDTLYVADSMAGQDAANTAQHFNQTIPITGVILTKTDADPRGGAALSIRHVTGAPIQYIGVGEKIDDLSTFHPDRVASSILNMGDILSLVEDIEKKSDNKHIAKFSKNFHSKQNFTLGDFRDQFSQLQKMGGISKIASKLPGMASINSDQLSFGDKFFSQTIAIINSMTKQEKNHPKIITNSRKQRISKGSGTQISDVNNMLKKYSQMKKMMKKIKKPGAMQQLMQRFSNPLK